VIATIDGNCSGYNYSTVGTDPAKWCTNGYFGDRCDSNLLDQIYHRCVVPVVATVDGCGLRAVCDCFVLTFRVCAVMLRNSQELFGYVVDVHGCNFLGTGYNRSASDAAVHCEPSMRTYL
jgi:hypothetical protein